MNINANANANKLYQLGLGGGCHWCTEAVFASVKGIKSVKQGWISSTAPNDNFSEAVLLEFDENDISLSEVIEIHLNTHSSTSDHSMRQKYRSAVYVMSDADFGQVKEVLDQLQKSFDQHLVTTVLPYKSFKLNEETYQDYYYKNPDKPFCQTYIKPKLEKLFKINPNAFDMEKSS